MLMVKYFLGVGGALLALLFICDAYLTRVPTPKPVADRAVADLPMMRIKSDRKWPERVVFNTSTPASTMRTAAIDPPIAAPPAKFSDIKRSEIKPSEIKRSEMLAKAQLRDAFAQAPPATSPASDLAASTLSKQAGSQLPPRRIARKRAPASMVLVAQQPSFGWSGRNMW
jgi:hypothetical protein